MKLSTRLTILTSACALALSAVACGDNNGSDDDNLGGASNSGGTGGALNTGGTGTGGVGTGGVGTGGVGTGGDGTGGAVTATQSILDIADDRTDLSQFLEAVQRAQLEAALEAEETNLTVFAPNNAAFTALLAELNLGTLAELSAAQLRPILLYHVMNSRLTSAEAIALAPGNGKGTSLGGTFEIAVNNNQLVLDQARVTVSDLAATNGIIHIVDKVMLPSITDIVTTDPNLAELKKAIEYADSGTAFFKVAPFLDGPSLSQKWLFFAPTNAAFTSITPPTDKEDLAAVLFYHGVHTANPPTIETASTFANETFATAHLGHNFVVRGVGTAVTVSDEVAGDADAMVVTGDIYAENGIIHVINKVLLPSSY